MTSIADHERATGGAERGRQADSPAQMPALGWKEIFLRTVKESGKDNIALVAAGVAFYAFLAIVPLMGATVLTYGFIASPETVIGNMRSLMTIAPPDIAQTIGDMLLNVVKSSGNKKGLGIFVALAVALWGARNAAGSIMIALNISYEEEEARGFVTRTLVALAMTLGLVVLALAAIAAMGALRYLQTLWPGGSDTAVILGKTVSYPMLGIGAAAAAATIYRYGPSRQQAKWSWLTPGSIFSAVGWLLTTAGFGLYVTRFANYNATYGSIGGIVALLTWIYLSSYIFLFGAELNSEVEHQTAKDTTRGGAKPLGSRGAWSADHVADGAEDEGGEAEGRKPSPMADDKGPEGAAEAKSEGSSVETVETVRTQDATVKTASYHPLMTSRMTSVASQIAGSPKIGMMSSILSTAGLSLLRKRGKARVGAALLLTAAGLALIKREPDPED